MKKIYALTFFVLSTLFYSNAQTVIPVTDELVLPQYAYYGTTGISGSTNIQRVHYVCRLKLTGLTPSVNYRYLTGMSSDATLTTAQAPGNLMSIKNNATTTGRNIDGMAVFKGLNGNTLSGNNVVVGSSSSIYSSVFTSDASGNYTGWFATVPVGNATQQAAGSNAYFYVQISLPGSLNNTQYSPAVSYRTTSTIKLLDFSNTSGSATGITALVGTSDVADEKMVSLYDNTTFTGRPIYTSFTENDSLLQNQANFFTGWYSAVDGFTGRFGAIIPNNLAGGIKGIQFYNIDGTAVTLSNSPTPNISADGSWNGVSTVNVGGGSSNPVVINAIANTILPVNLLSFTANAIKEGVKLDWQTAQEINNKQFEVLRSSDNRSFKTIATISGKNNSQATNSYAFLDVAPTLGTNYYQLKQVDLDGKYTIFNTVVVKFNGSSNQLRVVASSANELKIALTLSEAKKGSLIFADMDGRAIYKKEGLFNEGVNIISIPTQNTSLRIGVLNFTTANDVINLKVFRN